MGSLKQRTVEFLQTHFDGLRLRSPLYSNGGHGLRFDLQHGVPGTEMYFEDVVDRATE